MYWLTIITVLYYGHVEQPALALDLYSLYSHYSECVIKGTTEHDVN